MPYSFKSVGSPLIAKIKSSEQAEFKEILHNGSNFKSKNKLFGHVSREDKKSQA